MYRVKQGKTAKYACLIALAAAALALAAMLAPSAAYAEKSVASLFSAAVTTDASIPESAGVDERKGALLSADRSGTEIKLGGSYAGRFALDFRVYSDLTYTGPVNELKALRQPAPTSYVNPFADFDSLVFTVKDESDPDNAFRIGLYSGMGDNETAPNAYVEYEGVKYGVYYDPYIADGTKNGGTNETKIRNAIGYYTALTGSSFCNSAYYCGDFHKPDPTVLVFDAEAMQVYSYAYDATGVYGKRLILDLKSGMNDLMKTPVLSGFETFEVSVAFEAVKTGKTAKLLAYAINGQSLAGQSLADDTPPIVRADLPACAEKGRALDLSGAIVSDVADGISPFDGNVTAYINGIEQTITRDGGAISVVPDRTGVMTVAYTAVDAAGNAAERSVDVLIADSPFGFGYEADVTPAGSYGVGETLTLNGLTLPGSFFGSGYKVVYSLTKDDAPVEGFADKTLTEPLRYVFPSTGLYRLELGVEGFAARLQYTYAVTGDIPSFLFDRELEPAYDQGDRLVFPTVRIRSGGEEKTAEPSVRTPAGVRIRAEGFLYLSEYGRYELTYAAVFGGKTIARAYAVNVRQSGGDFITDNVTETKGVTSAYYDIVSGTLLTPSPSGGKVKYNRTVDLSGYDDKVLLELYSHNTAQDEGALPSVKITDADDPSNYVTVTLGINVDWYYGHFIIYVTYGLSGTVKTYVTQTQYAKSGLSCGGYGNASMRLYYDWEDKAIYCRYWEERLESTVCYLSSLDETWKGFSTGKATVEITIDKPVLISEIGGKSLAREDAYTDGVPPVISVDSEGYDDCPPAEVGREYRLFGARAFDAVSGAAEVTKAVYLDYHSPFKRLVAVDADSFVPAAAETYYVEYSATDAFGNRAYVTLPVRALDRSEFDEIAYTFGGDFPETGTVGRAVLFPTVSSLTGGSGRVSTRITVTGPDGKTAEAEKSFTPQAAGLYTIEYRFTDYVGRSKTETFEVDVSVGGKPIIEDFEMPFAYVLSGSEVRFPTIKAKEYRDGRFVDVPVEITVQVGDGEAVRLEGDRYVPTTEPDSSAVMTVLYTAAGEGGTAALPKKEITVVNPYLDAEGSLDMRKFFAVSDGVTVESDDDWGYLQFGFAKDSQLAFVNKLLAKSVSAQFSIPAVKGGQPDFSAVTFTLTDALDGQSVAFTFGKIDGSAETCGFRVNGGKEQTVQGGFGGLSNISFRYSDQSFMVTDGGTTIYSKVGETTDGEPFNGFTSGYVYLTISATGVGAPSQLRLVNVNGQTLSSMRAVARPLLEYETERFAGGTLELGGTLDVPAIAVNSVLFGIRETRVTVLSGGKKVIDNADASLSYEYTVTENANCRITYEATTFFGKTLPVISYSVAVVEWTPPVITVSRPPVSSARVGDKVTVYGAVADDAVSGRGELYSSQQKPSDFKTVCQVFVVSPRMEVTQLFSDDLTFTADRKGVWYVRYYAYDENDNFATVEYAITVE